MQVVDRYRAHRETVNNNDLSYDNVTLISQPFMIARKPAKDKYPAAFQGPVSPMFRVVR
jgi:hypothetical protein